jgi:hypothetical protein
MGKPETSPRVNRLREAPDVSTSQVVTSSHGGPNSADDGVASDTINITAAAAIDPTLGNMLRDMLMTGPSEVVE